MFRKPGSAGFKYQMVAGLSDCGILGPTPTPYEVKGEWRKLHNEELSDLYSLTEYCAGGKIEKNEMGGACGEYGGGERVAQGSGGET